MPLPFGVSDKVSALRNADWKTELQPSSLKGRAQGLQDRFSSASSTGSGNVHPRPALENDGSAPPRRVLAPPPGGSIAPRSIPPPPARSASGSSNHSASAAVPLPPRRNPVNSPPAVAAAVPAAPARRSLPSPAEPAPAYEDNHSSAYGAQGLAQYSDGSTYARPRIDWQNMSNQDKKALFAGLDNIFKSASAPKTALRVDPRADIVQPPVAPSPRVTKQYVNSSDNSRTRTTSSQLHPKRSSGKPDVHSSASLPSYPLSYPPPSQTASHAQDVAEYFSSANQWREPWFTKATPLPPPLDNRSDMTWTSSWTQIGPSKTVVGTALFCDLSVVWWKVEWNVTQERSAGLVQTATRSAKYLGRPAPLGKEELWAATSSYGEQVAIFAENAEVARRPVAHGECWDLASQGLASVTDLAAPVPSITRTHGCLLFSGTANGKNYKTDQTGTWRGDDTSIRRGDIVEWRKVRLAKLDGSGYSDLGAPDHTAIIVQTYLSADVSAAREARDGQSLPPWAVGSSR